MFSDSKFFVPNFDGYKAFYSSLAKIICVFHFSEDADTKYLERQVLRKILAATGIESETFQASGD